MNRDLFLIAIGGTGVRCLEAFVHMCAIGMMDNRRIHVLAIDTDFNNGNLERTRTLVENYIKIKTQKNGEQQKHKDSFFSAEIIYYEFTPEYTGNKKNFKEISRGTGESDEAKRQNQVVANLLFDNRTQVFNLAHGYRGQTHLGSHLMYHSIKEELYNLTESYKEDKGNNIKTFIDKLSHTGEESKVFIMGSIFGGTGASSIPILPRALRDALKTTDKSADLNPLYGATLLTSYFSFRKPKNSQIREESVIADSSRFSLNCQAALRFYTEDRTIAKTYKRLYHIGWPGMAFDYDQNGQSNSDRETTQTKTGGKDQRNPAHVIELMCASAAIHYFLDKSVNNRSLLEHVYRSIPYDQETKRLRFGFEDFVNKDLVTKFKRKLSAFIVFAMMVQNDFHGNLETLLDNILKSEKDFLSKHGYNQIDNREFEPLNAYLRAFAFHYQGDSVYANWFHQIQKSSESEDFLEFASDIYSSNPATLSRANWGKVWKNREYHWPRAGGLRSLLGSRPFEKFSPAIRGNEKLIPEEEFQKRLERLINHIYRTIDHLHAISKTNGR